MRFVCLFLVIFLHINSAFADDHATKEKLRTLSVHMNSMLNQTELALLAASDFLTDRQSVSGSVVEATLQRYVDQVDGLRALLITDGNGRLVYDTFNKIATKADPNRKPLMLGDRQYFKGAREVKGMRVYEPVIGRTSGTPFLPISQPVYVDEDLKFVIIAILSPNKLIHNSVHDSEYAVVTIYDLQGKFIAGFPDGTEIPQGYFKSLDIETHENGLNIVPFHKNEAHANWIINEDYGLALIFSKIKSHR